jgi:hypothetical protein
VAHRAAAALTRPPTPPLEAWPGRVAPGTVVAARPWADPEDPPCFKRRRAQGADADGPVARDAGGPPEQPVSAGLRDVAARVAALVEPGRPRELRTTATAAVRLGLGRIVASEIGAPYQVLVSE